LKKIFRKYLPDAHGVRASRLGRAFGPWLQHPSLWHLNRRSVSGGVAIGLFAGLVPGPFQMLTALLLAVPLRKNVAVALLTTLYTNPVTIVPLYLVAFAYGRLLLGESSGMASAPAFEMDWTDWAGSAWALWDWMLALGKPLALGIFALAVTLALLGYVAVQLAWRVHVTLAWRRRGKMRGRPR
jgi:hypothetical protein